MINSIINKSYKLNKTIEYYYDKSGNIKKTNHYSFNNNGLKQFTYLYENVGDGKFREIDLTNGVVRSVFELNKTLKKFNSFTNDKTAYEVEIRYDDIHNVIFKRSNFTDYYYNYSGKGRLLSIDVFKNEKIYQYTIDVQHFGNSVIYLKNDDIVRVKIYDEYKNLIYEIYSNLYYKREYNKKGLVTKLEIYSSNLI